MTNGATKLIPMVTMATTILFFFLLASQIYSGTVKTWSKQINTNVRSAYLP